MQAGGLATRRGPSSDCELMPQTPREEVVDRQERRHEVEAEEEAAQVDPRRQKQRPQVEGAEKATEQEQLGDEQSVIARSVERHAS